MKRLFYTLTAAMIISLIFLLFFFYIGVFSPLRDELGATLIEDFKSTVSITEINVENYLSRCQQGAESLSSRTMIKNKLFDYKNDKLSFEGVKNYTQPKYEDGAAVLGHVLASYRFTGKQVIAKCEKPEIKLDININQYNKKITSTIITVLNNKKLVIINSPIIKKDQLIGNDIVVFDITPLFKQLNEDRINYEVIKRENINNTFVNSKEEVKSYRQILDTNYWLKAQLPKAKLNKGLNDLITKIVTGLIFLLIIIIIIFGFIINQTYNKVIKSLRDKIEKITELSETDYMLNIYNRSKFMEELKNEIKRVNRYGNNLSLIMLDVDYFKEINDRYGHMTGDQILIKLTEVINRKIRDLDIFARYGGDEFIIITPNTDLDEAAKLAQRLRESIAETNFENLQGVTCSFGVAEYSSQDNIDSFIKKVDDALYQAKENGRNRVEKKK